ncbi:uncharacterized protein LOC121860463 [Homarus americanus]|uniref:uncharacterized protein LOC121860463 n=1 Tax=Homarus americanus TaxID=6706 RepID=UPI001C44DEFB|nr:uncharacterized protein LOC121860463 [Homarus americanus]
MIFPGPRMTLNITPEYLLKSCEEVTLTVATTSQLPTSVVVAQTYSWVTPEGRATSPPPEYNPRLHHHQVSRVEVEVVGSESLGLMIRGGVEYGLGIFITGVDDDSAAHKAGLQVGDQILEVNAESFLAVTHDTAVNILKYSRRLRLAVRRVGKVPHSCTTYDRRCWPPTQSNGETSAENMEATLAMIDEKSQRVLTRTHHARLKEVVSDYAAGRIPVEHLLITTRDLLNSPDKMSLLTELREVVRPEDQDKFDAAVFRTAARVQDKTDAYGGQISNLDDFIDMYNRMEIHGDDTPINDGQEEGILKEQRVPDVPHGKREISKASSEDSGVEMSNGAMIPRRDGGGGRARCERKRSGKVIRENGTAVEGVTWADTEEARRIDSQDFNSQREQEERHSAQPERQKLLQKRFSERLLPKTQDLVPSTKPQRRHSHTGELNGAAGGKPLPKSLHAPTAHPQRSALSHARTKKYDDFSKPQNSRGREEYDLLPSTRVRDEFDLSPSRLRDDYDSSSRLIDDYDSPSARVRDNYDISPSREIDDYDHSPSRRDEYDPSPLVRDEYDPSTRGRDEYDPSMRSRDEYDPSTRVRDDYNTSTRGRDEYDPSTRGREEYESSALRGREEYDTSSRVRDDYDPVPARVRDDYNYDPPHPGRHRNDYDTRDEYTQQAGRCHENYDVLADEYEVGVRTSSREDFNSTPHFREVFDESPSRNHFASNHLQVCGSSGGTAPSSPSPARTNSSEKREDTHPPYACRNRRTSLVVSDSLGRFRVVVKKTRPNLGIAIEGGADTKQKLPRVINIAANGAAFEAGGLRVGQLILAVDGQKLDGQSHEEAARLIAGCWISRSRPEVEFMVVERKPTASDVRRSSISLLSQM